MNDNKPILTVTIADCRVDTFRCGGAGGQKQNKTSSGVRIVHEPSGAVGESREERSQQQNKKIAFFRMAYHPKMIAWQKRQVARITGEQAEIERAVEAHMQESKIRTEVKDNGRWVEVNPNELSEEEEG